MALLRAVNVGGRNKVPMALLRTAYHEVGGAGVETYIQSGNVVFDHHETDEVALAARLRGAIVDSCGVDSPVILRTGAELAQTVGANPWPDLDPQRVHVTFLATAPGPAAVAELEAKDVAPDRIRVVGRDLYAHLPDGVAGTRIKPAVVARLVGPGTARNWRTATKLAELVEARVRAR